MESRAAFLLEAALAQVARFDDVGDKRHRVELSSPLDMGKTFSAALLRAQQMAETQLGLGDIGIERHGATERLFSA